MIKSPLACGMLAVCLFFTVPAAAAKAASGKEESCRRDFSMNSVMSPNAEFPSAAEIEKYAPKIGRDFQWYYTCLALAKRDPRQCEPIKRIEDSKVHSPLFRPRTYHECLLFYSKMITDRAMLSHDPGAYEICVGSRKLVADDHQQVKLEDIPAFCAGFTNEKTALGEKCSAIARYLRQPDPAKGCEKYFRLIEGKEDCGHFLIQDVCHNKEGGCDNSKGEAKVFVCEEYKAYHDARKAHDIALCGDHTFCRMMMDAGVESCQPIADRIEDSYCALLSGQKK